MLGIKRTKVAKRGKYTIFALVTIADALIVVLTAGRFEPTWREDVLFSDWASDIDNE